VGSVPPRSWEACRFAAASADAQDGFSGGTKPNQGGDSAGGAELPADGREGEVESALRGSVGGVFFFLGLHALRPDDGAGCDFGQDCSGCGELLSGDEDEGEVVGTRTRRRRPQIVLREGKPAAVILDIDEYQEMLERLEDAEDLAYLKKLRSRKLRFRKLDEVLREHEASI